MTTLLDTLYYVTVRAHYYIYMLIMAAFEHWLITIMVLVFFAVLFKILFDE
jgi:hypothetical protein